jgi:predicted Zn-dependent peptidase
MKNFIYFLFIGIPVMVGAQNIDRTKAPAPGKAPIIQVASPVKYTLPNGLQVFVVKNTKLPRVTATLALDVESIKEGDKSGTADLAGQLLKRGTTTKSKAELDEAVEFLGGSLSTSSFSASTSGLKQNFPKLMELMAEVVFHPSLAPDELEKLRKQTLSGIESSKDDPNAISDNVVKKLVYGANHPYGELTTAKTVNNVTVQDIKTFISTYWKPNIAYLVFVGDIEPLTAKAMAEKYFGNWVKGKVPATIFPPVVKQPTYIAVVDRPASVQSNVTIASTINLKQGAPNAIASAVMSNILGGGFSGRLFANLREKHGFTYGAYASIAPNQEVGLFSAEASVRNEKTDSSIQELLREINIIRNEKVGDTELSRMKNYIAGTFARSLENPATVAKFALNIATYHMPADYYQKYLTNLASVNTQNVQDAAVSLLNPAQMHIVIVGNAKQIAKGLEKYGPVKYFDIEGNEIAAPVEAKADASLTPAVLLDKVVNAFGGKAALATIKDIQLKGNATVMGQSLDMAQTIISPNNTVITMSMGGMAITKQSVIDGNYKVLQQGMEAPINDEIKESLNESAHLVPEELYANSGYQIAIVGAEKIDGKDAIDVEITTPSGKKSHRFYDAATFLLVKTTKTQPGPGGTNALVQQFYKNYQVQNGVQVAVEQLIDMGQVKINVKYTDIKVNQGLKTSDL